ncbi:MAG: ribosome maturation factor RimP [Candidatus Omnitrophica bacterium]|nr:ribosome maturation factor RimP [Candidatus Omnitrophota bacterium]
MEPIETIKQLIKPVLERYNAQLADVNFYRSPGRSILRILVDKEPGISMDECAAINRELGEFLDKNETIAGPYLLEVSSPGMDRPLKVKKDFEKIVGEDISLTMRTSDGTMKTYQVKVDFVDDKCVTVSDKNGRVTNALYADIHTATLQIKF